MKGYSVLEVLITVIIFSTLLVVTGKILDVGLKSWNLVEIKSEVQQEAFISVNMLSKDLRLTDRTSADIGGAEKEYVIFENPLNENGFFSYDEQTGDPLWQSYIIYYTYPRKAGKPLEASDNVVNKKLIRKVIKHIPRFSPQKLSVLVTNFEIYFSDPYGPLQIGEELSGKVKVLSKHMYNMDIKDNFYNEDALDIKMLITKSIIEDRLAYVKDFSDDAGKEKIFINTTVLLKNSKN